MNCPYCRGSKVIKKGLRVKKLEKVQLFYCQNCQKKFTPGASKHKTFPLRVILDSLTLYNLPRPASSADRRQAGLPAEEAGRFATLEMAAKQVSEKYGLRVSPQNISNWLSDFADYLPFLRMRSFLLQKAQPFEAKTSVTRPHKAGPFEAKTEVAGGEGRRPFLSSDFILESQLFHGQIYDFKYHRAKCELILNEEFRHYRFRPLQEFLELVIAECPHSIFKESQLRASEFKDVFNLDKVKITPKNNMASKTARLVMQAVTNNKLRHQALQKFMLINDSVTVAAEVPVLLDQEDILHYRNELGFEIPESLSHCSIASLLKNNNGTMKPWNNENILITGHIDLLQVRNGSIHIMDFKPSAKKQKPVDQLTLYALALSRLTGLRLFHFKCAWFDEDDYFEFFPLHVVYKKKKKKHISLARPSLSRLRGSTRQFTP